MNLCVSEREIVQSRNTNEYRINSLYNIDVQKRKYRWTHMQRTSALSVKLTTKGAMLSLSLSLPLSEISPFPLLALARRLVLAAWLPLALAEAAGVETRESSPCRPRRCPGGIPHLQGAHETSFELPQRPRSLRRVCSCNFTHESVSKLRISYLSICI